MTVAPDAFRNAMRHLVASVCIITTADARDGKTGLTATAVCSVSASPATLLCCINRQSASYRSVLDNGCFAVNVLALEDGFLATRFASGLDPAERFMEGLWRKSPSAMPVLESALAVFDCQVVKSVDVGTHGIIFGEVMDVSRRDESAKALLYAHGGYGGFAAVETVRGAELLWVPAWQNAPEI